MRRSRTKSSLRSVLAPVGLVGLVVASTLLTMLAGCAAHETGHAVVGTSLGYEVVAVTVCPAPAHVTWADSNLAPIDTTVEAWAGGISSAALLALVYVVVFVLPRRPRRSAVWWALGLPLPAVAAGQLLIGILEGVSQGRYGAWIAEAPAAWVPVIAATALGGVVVHLRWLRGREWLTSASPRNGRGRESARLEVPQEGG